MSNYVDSREAAIEWLRTSFEALQSALSALGVEAEARLFSSLVPASECNLDSFWSRQRGGGMELNRVVLWVISNGHVQAVGSTTVDSETTGAFLTSVTVGTVNYDAPLKNGWARFQEYKNTASAGKQGIKITTVAQRFQGYYEVVLDPSKAAIKAEVQAGDSNEFQDAGQSEKATEAVKPRAQKQALAATSASDAHLLTAPGPVGQGQVYVHIPMTLVPVHFALALEALMRGAKHGVMSVEHQG